VRRVTLEPGRITIEARGKSWPCDLAAAARVPISVVVDLGGRRYCASFGGDVRDNRARRFTARAAPAPASCPSTRLTVADLNILHGVIGACASNASCRRPDRIALLFDWIRSAGCPDVVTLQEVARAAGPLLADAASTTCSFPYDVVYPSSNGIDDEMILTRYPAIVVEQRKLKNEYRTALFARLDHPLGPVDVFSTHLASGSDGAETPCGANCPAECVSAGAATVRQCQAVQFAGFVAERHHPAAPAVVAGDFNEEPGTFTYHQFADRGWPDTYLAAGRPECDPGTGVGCTSGRDDQTLGQMESTASNEVERIDYVFLVPPAAGHCTVDPVQTKIFADAPNPFAPSCGASPLPICWPSDHEGMQAAVDCR
jgi:endonuclease/exonuclease/phosphatase family metal-dependent hydrolase